MTDGPRRYLYDEHGRRRASDDVLAEYGNVVLRKALLDDTMHRLAERPDVVYPPRVFVSYKWESDEHRAWAAALADALIDLGWEVVVDRDFDPAVHRTVEEFVARLVRCGVFLAIATPAYVVHAMYPPMHDPSWVFDECQSAMLGELKMHRIALTPDGTLHTPAPQPEIFRASRTAHETERWTPLGGLGVWIEEAVTPTFDEIFVMPARDEITAWVADHMSYAGEPITGVRADQLSREVAAVEAAAGGDPSATADALEHLVREHPRVSALWTRYVQCLRDAGRHDDAVAACTAAVGAVDRRDGWRALQRTRVEVLQETGDRAGAFQAALELLERYPGDWMAHLVAGDHLDDLGEAWSARNHLLLATADEHAPGGVHNVLGVVYQRLGLLLCASRAFMRALELDPSEPNAAANLELNRDLEPTHQLAHRLVADMEGVGCTACRAIYPVGDEAPAICSRCGTVRAVVGDCAACGGDGIAVVAADVPVPWRCPTCRRGQLELRSHFDL